MFIGNYASGEKHPHSKLSAQDVKDIRRQYDAGAVTYRELAQQYGVGCSTISDILNHKTWRSITNES